MKKLSIVEFERYIKSINPNTYMISSTDQPCDFFDNTLTASSKYNFMMITLRPNSMCFKSDQAFLDLHRIKHIEIDSENEIGITFTVVCGGEYDTRYTMVAY